MCPFYFSEMFSFIKSRQPVGDADDFMSSGEEALKYSQYSAFPQANVLAMQNKNINFLVFVLGLFLKSLCFQLSAGRS